MQPDEARLRNDLERPNFEVGVNKGMWQLGEIVWPHVVIEISAAPRERGPAAYALRIQCDGYPQQAPTAQLWDPAAKALLPFERWPNGSERVQAAFNPAWPPRAIYLPFDRAAMSGHPAWVAAHPELQWRAACDITFYLKRVHDLLNTNEYTGVRGA